LELNQTYARNKRNQTTNKECEEHEEDHQGYGIGGGFEDEACCFEYACFTRLRELLVGSIGIGFSSPR
jgi:hypothetical protein